MPIYDDVYRNILALLSSNTEYRDIAEAALELNNWNSNQSNYAFEEFAKHLYLVETNPSKMIVSLSEAGTLMWRQFIYSLKSNGLIAGAMGAVNYFPPYATPIGEESEAYENTRQLYTLNFDKLPKDVVSSDSFLYVFPK